MFGKTRELNDVANFDGPNADDFFGDETAVAESVRVDQLHQRVTQVESQINSQFTSLATYAQIAQEQIELARAEAKASTERSEHRLTDLIERERADRIEAMGSTSGVVNIGSARSAMDERLDSLERSVAQIKITLDECFAQQLALADAINSLFEQRLPPAAMAVALETETVEAAAGTATVEPVATETATTADVPLSAPKPRSFAPPKSPIQGLSLRLDIA